MVLHGILDGNSEHEGRAKGESETESNGKSRGRKVEKSSNLDPCNHTSSRDKGVNKRIGLNNGSKPPLWSRGNCEDVGSHFPLVGIGLCHGDVCCLKTVKLWAEMLARQLLLCAAQKEIALGDYRKGQVALSLNMCDLERLLIGPLDS